MRCIYCGQVGTPSEEHVVQQSLGGNLTIDCVCESCNRGFSAIDQELAENWLPGMARVARTPEQLPVRLGREHFCKDPDTGTWLEIKVRNRFRAHLLPQVHLLADGQLYPCGGELAEIKRFVATVSKHVAAGTLRSVYMRTEPAKYLITPRLVQYRTRAVRVGAKTRDDGFRLLEAIEHLWPEVVARLGIDGAIASRPLQKPEAMILVSCHIDNAYRAIAKIGLNYLAFTKGAAFVLRPEFDDIREYICGRCIVHNDPLAPDEVAVDQRFVRSAGGAGPLPSDGHMVILLYIHSYLCCIVSLYGVEYAVRLGHIEAWQDLPQGHEFSIDRTWNRPLSVEDLYARVRASHAIRPHT